MWFCSWGSQTKSMNKQFENNSSIQMVAYVVVIVNGYHSHSEKEKMYGKEIFSEDRKILQKKFWPREIFLMCIFYQNYINNG